MLGGEELLDPDHGQHLCLYFPHVLQPELPQLHVASGLSAPHDCLPCSLWVRGAAAMPVPTVGSTGAGGLSPGRASLQHSRPLARPVTSDMLCKHISR